MNSGPLQRFSGFTGGALDTNAFLFDAIGGKILFDAPQGADMAFANETIGMLFLTHGHFDHVADAAAIKDRHGCRVVAHELTVPMVTEREFFKKWGFALEIDPVEIDELLSEGPCELLGEPCQLYHVPGHCPGSLCTLIERDGVLVGGDVLFAGGVGRWDLPGGDHEALLKNIHSKILPLDDATVVLTGHGPPTTIGQERESNPHLIRPKPQ